MIAIFLETGKDSTPEYVFMKTLLARLGIGNDKFKIFTVDGKDNLENARNHFIQNTLEHGINLIIFDADSPENNGGFDSRKRELENKISELKIEAHIFLFPNNSDDGDFECLLEELARHDLHNRFFDCFNDYETCLGNNYIHPNKKGKLHAYITSMPMSKTKRDRIGSGNWQFDNNDYWDLNCGYLDSLKNFILKHTPQVTPVDECSC